MIFCVAKIIFHRSSLQVKLKSEESLIWYHKGNYPLSIDKMKTSWENWRCSSNSYNACIEIENWIN